MGLGEQTTASVSPQLPRFWHMIQYVCGNSAAVGRSWLIAWVSCAFMSRFHNLSFPDFTWLKQSILLFSKVRYLHHGMTVPMHCSIVDYGFLIITTFDTLVWDGFYAMQIKDVGIFCNICWFYTYSVLILVWFVQWYKQALCATWSQFSRYVGVGVWSQQSIQQLVGFWKFQSQQRWICLITSVVLTAKVKLRSVCYVGWHLPLTNHNFGIESSEDQL